MLTTPQWLLSLSLRKVSDGIGIKTKTREGLPVYTTRKIIQDEYDHKTRKKIGVSVCSGCKIGCIYCFTRGIEQFKSLLVEEILQQVEIAEDLPSSEVPIDETKISYKQMGDPLLNQDNMILAIEKLYQLYPEYLHVVSTSAAKLDKGFFERLAFLSLEDVPLRLQFSCHTTSDEERASLSPNQEMMTLAKIATVVNSWPTGKVTLNFVMLAGYTYNADTLIQLFDTRKTFIKVNWLDYNVFIEEKNLRDRDNVQVQVFSQNLQNAGFTVRVRQDSNAYL